MNVSPVSKSGRPLAEIESVVCDAMAAALDNHRRQPDAETLEAARICLARLKLFYLVKRGIVESPLVETLSGQSDDGDARRAALGYAAKIILPSVLSDCGIPELAAMLDDDGSADDPSLAGLNPLDLNDLTRLCMKHAVDAGAVQVLYMLVANFLQAALQPAVSLNRQIVEYWGQEDVTLQSLYDRVSDAGWTELGNIETAAGQFERALSDLATGRGWADGREAR